MFRAHYKCCLAKLHHPPPGLRRPLRQSSCSAFWLVAYYAELQNSPAETPNVDVADGVTAQEVELGTVMSWTTPSLLLNIAACEGAVLGRVLRQLLPLRGRRSMPMLWKVGFDRQAGAAAAAALHFRHFTSGLYCGNSPLLIGSGFRLGEPALTCKQPVDKQAAHYEAVRLRLMPLLLYCSFSCPFKEHGQLCLCVKHFGMAEAVCVWLSGMAGAVLARCHAAPVRCLECDPRPLLRGHAFMCRLHSFMRWPAEYCLWLVDIHLYEADTAPGKSLALRNPQLCEWAPLCTSVCLISVTQCTGNPGLDEAFGQNLAAANHCIASLQSSHCIFGIHVSYPHYMHASCPRQAVLFKSAWHGAGAKPPPGWASLAQALAMHFKCMTASAHRCPGFIVRVRANPKQYVEFREEGSSSAWTKAGVSAGLPEGQRIVVQYV